MKSGYDFSWTLVSFLNKSPEEPPNGDQSLRGENRCSFGEAVSVDAVIRGL